MWRPLKRFSFTKIPCMYTCSQSNGFLRHRITKRIKTFYNVIITYWGEKKSKLLLSGTLIQIPWQILLSYLNIYNFTSIGIEQTCSGDSKEFCASEGSLLRCQDHWKLCCKCSMEIRERLAALQYMHTGAEGWILMLSLPSEATSTSLINAYFDMKM